MSLREQQNFLARLYTDAEFRRAFLSEPEKAGAECDLTEMEIREISEIIPEELEFFADSLFWKRLRETEKFLPVTKKALGEDFTKHFGEFSQIYNPQTVKKHFEDALIFCRFLQNREISKIAKNAAKFELAKLEFFGLEKRFVVCRLNFDIREFMDSDENPILENLENKTKIAVWLRIGKRARHFFI
jgi:hypothetical protein